jgi:DNA-binding MarR family transcriptional regulator
LHGELSEAGGCGTVEGAESIAQINHPPDQPLPASRLTEPQGLDDLLLYRLYRLLAVASEPVNRLCEGVHGITRREWRLVALLGQHGVLRSSQLAERALLDRARTSKAVTSLVGKGLVARRGAAGDARLVLLALTERGQALHDQVLPQVRAINQALLGGLDADAVAQFDRTLVLLQQQALRSGLADTLPRIGRHRGRRAG